MLLPNSGLAALVSSVISGETAEVPAGPSVAMPRLT